MMIKTCNGCRALEAGCGRSTFCILHHEIETTKMIGGISVSWKPKFGMCQKPKTRADLSYHMQAMCNRGANNE